MGRLSKAGLLFGTGAFELGIFPAAAGAWMKSYYAKADKKIQDDRKRRTFLLVLYEKSTQNHPMDR